MELSPSNRHRSGRASAHPRVFALASAMALATFCMARPSQADGAAPTYYDGVTTARTSVSEAPRYAPASVAVPLQVETRSHWYGWQTLSTDGAAIGVLLLAGTFIRNDDTDSQRDAADSVLVLSAATYALGGPIVHVAHRQWGKAVTSTGLRIGLPVTGILIGAALDRCGPYSDSDTCGAIGPGVGMLLGIGAAIALDASALAYEPVPVASATRARQPLATTAAPFVIADARHALLGVSGTF
ncbi:MAG TPA: hypothetical protein VNW92_03020 [Polyangiaceae bacterium]|jgi:hypothetical protein|nr:hypothetical protein [Polyangiaceae bacterium]